MTLLASTAAQPDASRASSRKAPARGVRAQTVRLWGGAILAALALAGFAAAYRASAASLGLDNARFRLDLSPLLQAGWLIQVHVAGVISAFVIGCVIFANRKGTTMHRTLGWIWVVAMAVGAVSSFFLRTNGDGSMSWIHAFSAWVVIALPVALAAIRMRNVRLHARFMTGMFVGGMLIAGLFTFLPGRLMWSLAFEA